MNMRILSAVLFLVAIGVQASPSPSPSPASCHCPTGFVMLTNPSRCSRTTTQSLTTPLPAPMGAVQGNTNPNYAHYAQVQWQAVSALPMDAHLEDGAPIQVRDANGTILPINVMDTIIPSYTSSAQYTFWKNRVQGQYRVSIKHGGETAYWAQMGRWYAKSVCLNIPTSTTYTFHVGSDNKWKLFLDGNPLAFCSATAAVPGNPNAGNCHLRSGFFSMNLPAGQHILEMKYANNGLASVGGPTPSALWVELFQNNLTSLQSVTTNAGLTTIFSTSSLVGPNGFDYIAVDSDNSPHCPTGFALSMCSSPVTCKKTEIRSCTKY